MKITSAQLEPGSLPHPLKTVQVRATRWGVVVQARPKNRKKPWSLKQRQQRSRFGFAGRMAATPVSLDLRTAMEMAKGTEQVPRDILTMAAMGRYYTIIGKDGRAWEPMPGPLVHADPAPEPEPTPTHTRARFTGMDWNHWDAAYTAANSTSAYAFKGLRFTPRTTVRARGAAAILDASTGGTYAIAVGTADAGGVIQTVTVSPNTTATRLGLQLMTFDLEIDLAQDVEHFALVGRTDQGGTHALPVWYGAPAKWLWPCSPGYAALLASASPAPGQTLNLSASNTNPPMGFDLIEPT